MSNQIDAGDMRRALIELPEETSHGKQPLLEHIYISQSHIKAIRPDSLLVTGMRGAGKTFWWSALQDKNARRLLSEHPDLSMLHAETEVRVGFGVKSGVGATPKSDAYPDKYTLQNLLEEGVDPQIIWRTVMAWHLAPDGHPLKMHILWPKRVKHVIQHAENINRLFEQRDDELDQQGIDFLVLFDALDRCADDWKTTYSIIRGLLQAALLMLSYKRICMKIFLRSDQFDKSEIANFPDASKVLRSEVQLVWPHHQLYGLLWHYLGNSKKSGEFFRKFLHGKEWKHLDIDGNRLFFVPHDCIFKRDIQREKFHAIAGEWMGTDHKRGFPYTWIPNHLADANGQISPRSFLAALRAAAEDTENQHQDDENALHYDSIKRSMQEASRIRKVELQEDYLWADKALESLKGKVVPCDFKDIAQCWEKNKILDNLIQGIKQGKIRRPPSYSNTGQPSLFSKEDLDAANPVPPEKELPPPHFGEGIEGVRRDIEWLGIFQRMQDGRVNIPDVFRVAYGIKRMGGVKPVR